MPGGYCDELLFYIEILIYEKNLTRVAKDFKDFKKFYTKMLISANGILKPSKVESIQI